MNHPHNHTHNNYYKCVEMYRNKWLLLLCVVYLTLLPPPSHATYPSSSSSPSSSASINSVTISKLIFSGGETCNHNCSVGEHIDTYACSDGRGHWNHGEISFPDPIPPNHGYVLHSLNGTVWGALTCDNQGPAVSILIMWKGDTESSDALIGVIQMSSTSVDDCSCSNCVVPQYFDSPEYKDGINQYLFDANNTLIFQLIAPPGGAMPVACLSRVDLTITYGLVSYSVTQLIPPRGYGSDVVNITGNLFYPSHEMYCKFDDIAVQATFVNATLITCTAPSSSVNYNRNVTVEVSEDGVSYTHNGLKFTYLAKREPKGNNNTLWVFAAIGTCVASVLFVAIAGYFYAQKHKPKGDQSLIDEKSRLINSEKYKQFGNVQPVDMSEIIIQQRIGRGSCAEVFMGSWRGTTVAIKKAKVFADDDEEFFMELSQEAAIMSELRHPNVLQFLGTASNPPEIVIIMEFMARGSLYRIIHDRTVELLWPRIRSMALDIARGMNYLHCSDPIIIHRDLKSHNLLVDEHFKVKVCDFGLSTMVKRHMDRFTAMTPVGTPCWTAPEVLRNEPYTEKADVYSYGVVLWELVTREDPYQGMPTFQIVIAVGQHKMRPLIPQAASPALSQLMVECWNEDPNFRPPFSEIVSRLEKM